MDQFTAHELASIIVEVRVDGQPIVSMAHGEAMPGVPATHNVRFRNGAVAFAYVSALALRLAEDGRIDLDAPIETWLPDLPGGDAATIRMLANMTAGYPDHVADEERFIDPFYANPFRYWTADELIAVSLANERPFPPGQNWDYSHAGFVILGQVLEAATETPLERLMQDYIIDPLALKDTKSFTTPQIPDPVLHAYTAERGPWEEATFWSPSWTMPEGAVQVSTISDVAASFDAIVGHDGFLTAESRKQMIEPRLVGFGKPLNGCPTCHTLTPELSFGLGVKLQNDWVFQTPSFAGYAAAVGTLPQEASPIGRVTIAVAVTFSEASFQDWSSALPNWADETVKLIAEAIVPDNPPPAFRH